MSDITQTYSTVQQVEIVIFVRKFGVFLEESDSDREEGEIDDLEDGELKDDIEEEEEPSNINRVFSSGTRTIRRLPLLSDYVRMSSKF